MALPYERIYATIELSFEDYGVECAKETLKELLGGYDVSSIDLRSKHPSDGFIDLASFTEKELEEIY